MSAGNRKQAENYKRTSASKQTNNHNEQMNTNSSCYTLAKKASKRIRGPEKPACKVIPQSSMECTFEAKTHELAGRHP